MARVINSNWHRHKAKLSTDKQTRALQSAYGVLKRAEDPRVELGLHGSGMTERQQRMRWAWHKLGHEVKSFSDLTLLEAAYLIDFLNGVPTRLDEKIKWEFNRLGVMDQAAYFEAICTPRERYSKNQWSFGGRSFHDLNRIDKIKLIEILVTREPKQEPRPQGSGNGTRTP